jgi:hypothetical protein
MGLDCFGSSFGTPAADICCSSPALCLSGIDYLSESTQANGTVRVSPADPNRVDDIEFALSNPDIVYAAAAGYSIYRSDDGGASWLLLVNLRTDGVIN